MILGTIKISDLKILSKLGVYPEERLKCQELNLDLTFKIDISRCIITDSIGDTVNYEEVQTAALTLFSEKAYFLIETFAYELACVLFKKFPILHLHLEIKKKEALFQAKYASVCLEMTREEYQCLGH